MNDPNHGSPDGGFTVPERLERTCAGVAQRMAWLEGLPAAVEELRRRWGLVVGAPLGGAEGSCAWVAPVEHPAGEAVLKLGMPHFEADHEADALRLWEGDGAVRLLACDDELGALLLERCRPGTPLRELPEPEQDEIVAGLLRRLWRPPPASHRFRPLADMLARWGERARERAAPQPAAVAGAAACAPASRPASPEHAPDPALVEAGVDVLMELAATTAAPVVLATDLHAGNVLRARREPWLAIDPKPFIGDRAYDATQHLLNCEARVLADPRGTTARFAHLLELEPQRVRLWLFARAAVGGAGVDPARSAALARALRP